MDKKQKKIWDKLMKAWNEGKTSCHIHFAKNYVSTYPDNMYGWIVLADVLAGMALYKEARKALQKSLNLCPPERNHQVYVQLGHMYKQKCDLKRAEKWYRKALSHHVLQEYHIFLGACLAKQSRFKEAKLEHKNAIQMKPETADEAFLNLGLIFRAEGNYKKAKHYFEKSIGIDPNYEDAKFKLQDIEELLAIKKK